MSKSSSLFEESSILRRPHTMHRELDWDHYRYCHEFPKVLHVRDKTHIAVAAHAQQKHWSAIPTVFLCRPGGDTQGRSHRHSYISRRCPTHLAARCSSHEILLVGAEHFGGLGSLDALSPEPDVIDGPVIPSLVSRCPPLHLLLERSDFGSCICSRAQVSAKPVLSI